MKLLSEFNENQVSIKSFSKINRIFNGHLMNVFVQTGNRGSKSIVCKAKITGSFLSCLWSWHFILQVPGWIDLLSLSIRKKIILMYYVNELLIHHSLIEFFKILYNRLKLKTCAATFSLDVPNVITFSMPLKKFCVEMGYLGTWKGRHYLGPPGKRSCCPCCEDIA